jgi:hypothetical protein
MAGGKASDMNDHAAAEVGLLDADRRHLIHPLHHPKEHAEARIFVEGSGAMLRTADVRYPSTCVSAAASGEASTSRTFAASAFKSNGLAMKCTSCSSTPSSRTTLRV